MNKYVLGTITILMGAMVISCSSGPEVYQTVVKGTISVSDSINVAQDSSNIEVLILDAEASDGTLDTLLNITTAKDGSFESAVKFPRKKTYRIGFSRNGDLIGSTGVILAENDTLFVEGELPDLGASLSITSHEHKAMDTYYRVNESFNRVAAFIQAGAIADSLIPFELNKWSDLYWDVFNEYRGTIASSYAAEKSVGLLSGLNHQQMLSRIDEALPADYMIPVALRLGKPYLAETKGFNAAVSYMDSLSKLSKNEKLKELILRDKIEMAYDSARIEQAKNLLDQFIEEYMTAESEEWMKRIRYDLNFLAPGNPVPAYDFLSMEGDSLSNETMLGEVYILEITALASKEYQDDLDRTFVIHEIYKKNGLKILTIPLDNDEITVNAFFNERKKVWPVADVHSFDAEKIIETFNITQVPIRLLIDENGKIVRKYVRSEFQDVIAGLNETLNNNSPE